MSDTGDRAVSALYITGHTRRWQPDLDGIPNQGQLDTSVPAYAVDLDAIQRAGIPPHVDDWLAERYAHPRPRVVRHRRTTRRGTVALWALQAIPAAVVIGLAFLIVYGVLRHATP